MHPRTRIAAAVFAAAATLIALRLLFPPRPLRESLQSIDRMALDNRRSAWGFNFEPAVVPLDGVVKTPYLIDAVSALTAPDLMTPEHAAKDEALTPGTWVAGIVINGEARAYPNTLLFMHECINDVLGGEPIAVTYQGLSDGLAAFSRRMGSRVIEFGGTGLVYHSSLLLYDRQVDPHDQSLWSQIERRAITGPSAGSELGMIDVERMALIDWVNEHPTTTIASHNTAYHADYLNDRLAAYYLDRRLMFPETETKRNGTRVAPAKAAVVVVRAGENERAYLLRDLAREGGRLIDRLGGVTIELRLTEGDLERRVRHWALAMLLFKHLPFGWNLLQFDPSYAYTSLRRMRVKIEAIGGDNSVPVTRAYMLWHVWESIYPEGDYYRTKYTDEFEAENALEDEENE